MPPTQRTTWDDIDKVDSALNSDKRFDWLAGTHRLARFLAHYDTTSTEAFPLCVFLPVHRDVSLRMH